MMKTIGMILLWFTYLSNGLGAQSTFYISGEGFIGYQQVTLKYFDYRTLQYAPLDSASLESGAAFAFTAPFTGPNLFELNFDEKELIHLSVENTTAIAVKRVGAETRIEGSPLSVKMQAFRQQNEQLQARYFGQMKIDLDQAMAENDQQKMQEIQQQSVIAIQQFLVEFRSLIVSLGTTPAGYYALQFSDFNKEMVFIEGRLEAFEKEAPGSPVTLALAKQVYQAKNTAIGKTPPAFTGNDLQGKMVNLADYQGKMVLIDFWAAWCRACRLENPKLAGLYETYHSRGFEIISISQDKTRQQWENAIAKDGIGAWTQLWDQDNSISELYSVSSLPQNILLDKSGAIIAKNVDAEALQALLSKMMQ